jgi:hypothetical protein
MNLILKEAYQDYNVRAARKRVDREYTQYELVTLQMFANGCLLDPELDLSPNDRKALLKDSELVYFIWFNLNSK